MPLDPGGRDDTTTPAGHSTNTRYRETMHLARQIVRRRYAGLGSADQDDLVSEVMIKYWLKFGSESGPEYPRAWLSGVACSTAIDRHRARERRPSVPQGDVELTHSWVDGWLGAVERTGPSTMVAGQELMEEVLGLVSDEERELITLKYLYRQSAADIAEQIGKSLAATNQAINRAKKRLSTRLAAEPVLLAELRAAMPRLH